MSVEFHVEPRFLREASYGASGVVDLRDRGQRLAFDLAAVSGDRDAVRALIAICAAETGSNFGFVVSQALQVTVAEVVEPMFVLLDEVQLPAREGYRSIAAKSA